MPSPFPRPVPPGSVSANVLDAVSELHVVCRRWVESARSHLPANFNLTTLPYIDLLFAFGFATLGDAVRARRLLADAKAVMGTPDTPPVGCEAGSVATIISGLAYRAFEYRIEQAIAGVPLSGPLVGEPLATLDRVRQHAEGKRANEREFDVQYVFRQLHRTSRILDPVREINPYSFVDWPLNEAEPADPVKRCLAELQAHPNPPDYLDELRRQFHSDDRRQSSHIWLGRLYDGLQIAERTGAVFAAELLELVPLAIASATGERATKDQRRDWELHVPILLRAVQVAGDVGRADLTGRMAEQFTSLMQHCPADSRLHLIKSVGPVCLRSLQVLGLRDEIVKLGEHLRAAIPDLSPNSTKPEEFAITCQARLLLAATRLTVGANTDVDSILDDARALLSGERFKRRPFDFCDLVKAYLFALGQGTAESGLPRVIEIFQRIPPGAVQNAYTTAKYFSRLHLIVAETAVAAACRMLCEPPL